MGNCLFLQASRQSEADLKSENETLSKDMVALRDELLKRNKENAGMFCLCCSMKTEFGESNVHGVYPDLVE